jgi:hypothetical protein
MQGRMICGQYYRAYDLNCAALVLGVIALAVIIAGLIILVVT